MKPHTTHHDDCGCLSEKHRAEIDALRARVAEVEAERVAAVAACESVAEVVAPDADFVTLADRVRLALAASQAEARELREALAMTWPGISGHSAPRSPLGALGGDIQRTHRAATAALSRPPGDDTALREVCRKVAEEVRRTVNARAEADMLRGNPITGAHHRALDALDMKVAVNDVLGAPILGQPGDDAAPTEEE